jgi:hypothetical protein
MDLKYVVKQLKNVLKTNKNLSKEQKTALREAIRKSKSDLTVAEWVLIIQLLLKVMMMTHLI